MNVNTYIKNNNKDKNMAWTFYDDKIVENKIKGIASLPIGYKDRLCENCNSKNLIGAIITDTADESDPNILCLDCHYWHD